MHMSHELYHIFDKITPPMHPSKTPTVAKETTNNNNKRYSVPTTAASCAVSLAADDSAAAADDSGATAANNDRRDAAHAHTHTCHTHTPQRGLLQPDRPAIQHKTNKPSSHVSAHLVAMPT